MFGSHLSIAGGMHLALISAKELGFDSVQVFTKNQRQWTPPELTDEAVGLWKEHLKETGIQQPVSHASYLINLAAVNPETRKKSIDMFEEELRRCEVLEIPYLVIHPGAHMGEGVDAGIEKIVDALNEVHRRLKKYRTITCLENTAGQGSSVGHELVHLRRIIDAVDEPGRLAVCIDSAHALAAGYDLTSASGAKGFIKELDEVLGLEAVKAMHLNDSKTKRGSRVDRHEHIGHGHVSLEAFEVLVRNRHLKKVPKILETPKEKNEAGEEWDVVNLRVLKGLVKGGAKHKS